jgi:prolyl 4-hydroxylase
MNYNILVENPLYGGLLLALVVVILLIVFYYYQSKTTTVNGVKSHLTNPIDNPLHPPILALYDNYVSKSDCKEIISFGEKLVRPSPVGFDNDSDDSVRSSWQAWINPEEYPVISRLQDRICALIGYPSTHNEQFQLVRYKQNQQYKHHLDSCNPHAGDYEHCKNDARISGGFRQYTFLIYLNGDFEGGETDFPMINKKVKPAEGRAVLFRNILPGTNDSDPLSLHAGLPVRSGTKWAINVWIRNGPYRPKML